MNESAPGPSRVPLILSVVFSSLIFGAALLAPFIARSVGYEPEPLDLSAVKTYDINERLHSEDDIRYPQNPPAGGNHASIWLACGVYDVPVREENAVHDLEHGTVWITYDPSLPGSQVELLADQLPDNGILSPRAGLPSPVVITVWGAQLELDVVDDERLGMFIAKYGDGHTAPELGASCEGGTPDPQGGTATPDLGA